MLREYLPPRGRHGLPPLELGIGDPQPRHVVDMIIGCIIPHHNVMNLEAPPQGFRLFGTAISFTNADYPEDQENMIARLARLEALYPEGLRKALPKALPLRKPWKPPLLI